MTRIFATARPSRSFADLLPMSRQDEITNALARPAAQAWIERNERNAR
ncbi:hypothetical protein [Croceicoccus sp. YJ47]|nr:hypothetical protein [Croceicoccus sp. YJ47]QQN73918.1 hypothetical protein JD971_14405 [Croceicoccus sp. YJ47]